MRRTPDLDCLSDCDKSKLVSRRETEIISVLTQKVDIVCCNIRVKGAFLSIGNMFCFFLHLTHVVSMLKSKEQKALCRILLYPPLSAPSCPTHSTSACEGYLKNYVWNDQRDANYFKSALATRRIPDCSSLREL